MGNSRLPKSDLDENIELQLQSGWCLQSIPRHLIHWNHEVNMFQSKNDASLWKHIEDIELEPWMTMLVKEKDI
jgi:hypothetical protein